MSNNQLPTPASFSPHRCKALSFIGLVLAFTAPLHSQTVTLTNLHSFALTEGGGPVGGLIQGADSYLYGTTAAGGASNEGTIFKISTAGDFSELKDFSGSDGAYPSGTLVQGSDGAFYGSTYSGGSQDLGTVFKITASGVFTSLHSFIDAEGSNPVGSLIQGADGYYHGAATLGGADSVGAVFRFNSSGAVSNIRSLYWGESNNPSAGVIQADDGFFYGPTASDYGSGTIYKVGASRSTFATIHYFTGANGSNSMASLVQGSDGSFYGTTYDGGTNNLGTVFKLTPSGVFSTLHHFAGTATDGSYPAGNLIQASDGAFYGTTSDGGSGAHGTIFKITSSGVFKHLVSLDGANGDTPFGGLVQAGGGYFYGTAVFGGSTGLGTIFQMSVSGIPKPTRLLALKGPLIFGSVTVGATKTIPLTITNTGNSPLKVTGLVYPSGFSGNWLGIIPAGRSHIVNVTFTPTGQQPYSGTVTVKSEKTSGGNTLPISGTGVAATASFFDDEVALGMASTTCSSRTAHLSATTAI